MRSRFELIYRDKLRAIDRECEALRAAAGARGIDPAAIERDRLRCRAAAAEAHAESLAADLEFVRALLARRFRVRIPEAGIGALDPVEELTLDERRDAFIDASIGLGIPLKAIRHALGALAFGSPIATPQGVRQAAARHRKRHNLPPRPPRRRGSGPGKETG